jgi:hypothetical protein
MGKSALRLVVKAAKIHPVTPRPDKQGVQQPAYLRGGTAIQTSPRLRRFKACIARRLGGQKGGGRRERQRALAEAAKACKAEIGG